MKDKKNNQINTIQTQNNHQFNNYSKHKKNVSMPDISSPPVQSNELDQFVNNTNKQKSIIKKTNLITNTTTNINNSNKQNINKQSKIVMKKQPNSKHLLQSSIEPKNEIITSTSNDHSVSSFNPLIYFKLKEENLELRLANDKLKNENSVMKEQISSFERILKLKENENSQLVSQYQLIISEYKKEIENLITNKTDMNKMTFSFGFNLNQNKDKTPDIKDTIEELIKSDSRKQSNMSQTLKLESVKSNNSSFSPIKERSVKNLINMNFTSNVNFNSDDLDLNRLEHNSSLERNKSSIKIMPLPESTSPQIRPSSISSPLVIHHASNSNEQIKFNTQKENGFVNITNSKPPHRRNTHSDKYLNKLTIERNSKDSSIILYSNTVKSLIRFLIKLIEGFFSLKSEKKVNKSTTLNLNNNNNSTFLIGDYSIDNYENSYFGGNDERRQVLIEQIQSSLIFKLKIIKSSLKIDMKNEMTRVYLWNNNSNNTINNISFLNKSQIKENMNNSISSNESFSKFTQELEFNQSQISPKFSPKFPVNQHNSNLSFDNFSIKNPDDYSKMIFESFTAHDIINDQRAITNRQSNQAQEESTYGYNSPLKMNNRASLSRFTSKKAANQVFILDNSFTSSNTMNNQQPTAIDKHKNESSENVASIILCNDGKRASNKNNFSCSNIINTNEYNKSNTNNKVNNTIGSIHEIHSTDFDNVKNISFDNK